MSSPVYSTFDFYEADLGVVAERSVVSAIFRFQPIVENNPKYLFNVPSCGCLSGDWKDNVLTIKYAVGAIGAFHKDLGITELPQIKSVSVFIEEHGIQKEHVLTLKAKIVL